MRWTGIKTQRARKRALRCLWHSWFAWYPIAIKDPIGDHEMTVWMEWVQRRRVLSTTGPRTGWHWEYRENPNG